MWPLIIATQIGLSFKNLPKSGDTYKSDRSDKDVYLEISGEQGTKVGLLAVDEAIFKLRYFYRLTQKKVCPGSCYIYSLLLGWRKLYWDPLSSRTVAGPAPGFIFEGEGYELRAEMAL